MGLSIPVVKYSFVVSHPQEYLFQVDPVGQLGLTEDSVSSYQVGEIMRDLSDGVHHHHQRGNNAGVNGVDESSSSGAEGLEAGRQRLPELLPCGYLVGDTQDIKLGLRDGPGSVDALAFETLTPKAVIQR
jgi:hypothetical protein